MISFLLCFLCKDGSVASPPGFWGLDHGRIYPNSGMLPQQLTQYFLYYTSLQVILSVINCCGFFQKP